MNKLDEILLELYQEDGNLLFLAECIMEDYTMPKRTTELYLNKLL